jgi:hypothetical protein
MNSRLFWVWLIVSGLEPVFQQLAWALLKGDIARFILPLYWGEIGFYTVYLVVIVFTLASVFLPGLVMRIINPKVPLWIYVVGVICYVGIHSALGTLASHQQGSWWHVNRVLRNAPDNVMLGFYDLSVAASLAIIWPFLCYSPMMVIMLLRERNWRFPLQYGMTMSVASAFSGVLGLIILKLIFADERPPLFAERGLQYLSSTDAKLFIYWFLPAAIGANISYKLLLSNPAHHHQSNPLR